MFSEFFHNLLLQIANVKIRPKKVFSSLFATYWYFRRKFGQYTYHQNCFQTRLCSSPYPSVDGSSPTPGNILAEYICIKSLNGLETNIVGKLYHNSFSEYQCCFVALTVKKNFSPSPYISVGMSFLYPHICDYLILYSSTDCWIPSRYFGLSKNNKKFCNYQLYMS